MSGTVQRSFLRWALPRLGLRWRGYRRVHRQVCKRLRRRCAALGLADLAAYRARLEAHPAEWEVLEGLCRIPISRFFRHRALFEELKGRIAGARCWSAGCASGEEPYSLAMVGAGTVLATDADPHLLERARRAVYPASSVREVPAEVLERAFERTDAGFRVREAVRARVRFLLQDLRRAMPDGPFDVILCRYVAFTYFVEEVQREVLAGLVARLAPGGLLAIGAHETLPPGHGLVPVARSLYARQGRSRGIQRGTTAR